MNIRRGLALVLGILKRGPPFDVGMAGFTFVLVEMLWSIIFVGESLLPTGVTHGANDWYALFFPIALWLLPILFRSVRCQRAFKSIALFISVCAVATLIVAWLGFVPGLQTGLQLGVSILIGAACGCFIYMDNLQFLRDRIGRIGTNAALEIENRRLVIQLTMEEARAYFDNTIRGIYAIGSATVIVVSIIWAVKPVAFVMNDAQRLLLTLTSVLIIFLLLGGALVWLARPASECMTRLSEILLESAN